MSFLLFFACLHLNYPHLLQHKVSDGRMVGHIQLPVPASGPRHDWPSNESKFSSKTIHPRSTHHPCSHRTHPVSKSDSPRNSSTTLLRRWLVPTNSKFDSSRLVSSSSPKPSCRASLSLALLSRTGKRHQCAVLERGSPRFPHLRKTMTTGGPNGAHESSYLFLPNLPLFTVTMWSGHGRQADPGRCNLVPKHTNGKKQTNNTHKHTLAPTRIPRPPSVVRKRSQSGGGCNGKTRRTIGNRSNPLLLPPVHTSIVVCSSTTVFPVVPTTSNIPKQTHRNPHTNTLT